MKKITSILLVATMSLTLLAGCGGTSDETTEQSAASNTSEASSEYQPVSIENFDQVTEYTEKPDQIVTLTLNSAEIIAALGEADSIVGIAQNNNSVEDVLPEYYDLLKDKPFPEALNSGIPTLEGLLGINPDLVVANSYYFNVPAFGTMEDYQSNGVNFYVTEGSYISNATIENTYNDIRNLGEIFGQQEKAESLVADMQERVEVVQSKVEGQDPVRIMLFDSISEDSYSVAGGSGLAQNLVELAGGENVFSDVDDQFPSVSIEEIIARDPEVIVVHNYSADPEDAQSKIDFLKNSEELANVSAIKNDRIIELTLFAVNPGLQNVDAIEDMAAAMYPDLF